MDYIKLIGRIFRVEDCGWLYRT